MYLPSIRLLNDPKPVSEMFSILLGGKNLEVWIEFHLFQFLQHLGAGPVELRGRCGNLGIGVAKANDDRWSSCVL